MSEDALVDVELPLAEHESATYVLTLFVAGASEMSVRAIANVRLLCDVHLVGRARLEVVDVHRDPSMMSAYDVVAAPTLVKELPLPERRLVGDLSDTARVLAALDIRAVDPAPPTAPTAPTAPTP